MPNPKNARDMERLRDKDYNDYDQERRDNADGYRLIGLLHILHDVIRERVELVVGNACVAISARELILFLLKGGFEAINACAIGFRNER